MTDHFDCVIGSVDLSTIAEDLDFTTDLDRNTLDEWLEDHPDQVQTAVDVCLDSLRTEDMYVAWREGIIEQLAPLLPHRADS